MTGYNAKRGGKKKKNDRQKQRGQKPVTQKNDIGGSNVILKMLQY